MTAVPPAEVAIERALRWAAELVGDQATVFLDTETTGLGRDAEVVDIAVVAADGSILLDSLVRPRGPIPPDASMIHGIRNEDVRQAPTWPELFPRIAEAVRDRPVVVYNASFDTRIVRQNTEMFGLEDCVGAWQCAMRAYADFRHERLGRRGVRLFSLSAAAASFGLEPGGHRALGDALVCRSVVRAMAGLFVKQRELFG